MSVKLPKVALPGQPIVPKLDQGSSGESINYVSGPGTTFEKFTLKDGTAVTILTATVLGNVSRQEITSTKDSTKRYLVSVGKNLGDLPSVIDEKEVPTTANSNIPQEGDYVLARISKLSLRQANVEILVIEGKGTILKDSGIGSVADMNVSSTQNMGATNASMNLHPSDLGENFKGIVRSQDIKATERDKTKVIESFMPGDIIRAEVISLGDGSYYYLSTAKDELGVVFARSQGGELLYPIDYKTMISDKTGLTEARKCAKPF